MSGGIDSSTLAYYLKDKGHEVKALTFNYGQKHDNEIDAAAKICVEAEIPWKLVDISAVKYLLDSALTNDKRKIPEGHYADKNMESTVVPNRNMIMLSIAAGYAKSIGFDYIAFAAHGGDHFIYPDCRPGFVDILTAAIRSAFGHSDDAPKLIAPFVDFDKTDIVRMGHMLKVPFKITWSCYKGRVKHCGKCGTCVERKEAFKLAKVSDPTKYE